MPRPASTVTRRSSDLNGAMHAVRAGEAIAAVYIPRGLERDIDAGKRPQIVIFYNKQYFTPGNIASSALSSAVSAATADLPASSGAHGGLPARPAGRRAVCADQSGAELRPVPAAGDPAHGAARRHGDHRRLCRRLGIRSPGHARMDGGGGRRSTDRAGRQALALSRHLPDADGGHRGHPRRCVRGFLPRRFVSPWESRRPC